jgi:hypothetical protein
MTSSVGSDPIGNSFEVYSFGIFWHPPQDPDPIWDSFGVCSFEDFYGQDFIGVYIYLDFCEKQEEWYLNGILLCLHVVFGTLKPKNQTSKT